MKAAIASVFVVAAALILFLTLILGVHQVSVWVNQI